MTPSTRSHLPALASALLALALFAVSIGGTYIYDDVAIISPVHDSRLADPSQWGRYWTESYNQGVDNLYRPLVSMSYAIQWWLHGDRPWAFHLVNVLLHAAVSAAVAEFVRRLIGFRAAMVAGLLFAAHPIHVEAVANIVGRAELMCALGMLAGLTLLLRPMTPRRALAISGCFVFALLSKEQGMLLPSLLLILGLLRRFLAPHSPSPCPQGDPAPSPSPGTPGEGWGEGAIAKPKSKIQNRRTLTLALSRSTGRGDNRGTGGGEEERQGNLLLILLLCWMLAGYIVWRESILKFWWDRNFIDWTINPMVPSQWHAHGGSVGRDRWLMPLALLGRYACLLVFPMKLSPDYGAKVIGWSVRLSDPYLYLGVAAIVAWCVVLLVSLLKRSTIGIFATLSLALSYGMVGNIVALIGTNFAERLMYLPSAFFIMLVAAAVSKLPRAVLIVFTTIALILASVRTFTYTLRWNNALEFYRTSLAEQPKSIRLYMLLTSEYLSRGQFDQAERTVKAGRDMLPEYWEIWLHSGVVAMKQGDFAEAQRDFEHAVNIRPSFSILRWMDELQKQRTATQPATAPASAPSTSSRK